MAKEPTLEDWRFIADATQQRFDKAKPKKGEPSSSYEFQVQEERIMLYLLSKAYPMKGQS